jgi:predicted transcriptional regulator
MAKNGKTRSHDVAQWMEEQYRKRPGLREEVEAEVAELELAMGLVKLREDRGVSQAQLARMLDVSQPAIAKLESGRSKEVKVSTLMRYAKALGGKVKVEVTKDPKWGKVVPIRRAKAATG